MSVDFASTLMNDTMTDIITKLDAQSGPAKLEICTLNYATVLITITLAKPSFTLSGGILTMASMPRGATAALSGTAARARIKDSAGTVWINDLTVGAGAFVTSSQFDILLATTTITSGVAYSITSATIRPARLAPYTLSTAVGNGSTDDTTALQTALAAGDVFIPKTSSFYKITSTLNVTNDIYSDGAEIRFIQDGTVGKTILSVSNTTVPVTIDGLVLNGTYTTGTSSEYSAGIAVHGSANVTISNNTIQNCYGDNVTIAVSGAVKSSNVTIINNTMSNPRRCNMAIIGCTGLLIKNNLLIKTVQYVGSIDLEPNDSASSNSDITIIGNTIIGPTHKWVDLPTNATTAIGNPTLHFASGTIPSWVVGGGVSKILDLNNASCTGRTVSSTTATTVVMDGNAASPGVGSGDVIHFDLMPSVISADLLIGTGNNFGNAWGQVNIQNNVGIGQFFIYILGFSDAGNFLIDGNTFCCSRANFNNLTNPNTYMVAIDSTTITGVISNNVDLSDITAVSGGSRYISFYQAASGFTTSNNTFYS